MEDESKEEELEGLEGKDEVPRKEAKSKFANENVMSKSNLRQPKNFSFGFPDEDDEEEEEENDEKEEE